MRHTVTLTEELDARLRDAVFSLPGKEGAAYLLCGRSESEGESRLLVRDVIPVADEHYLIREPLRLSIASSSYASVAKKAAAEKASLLFVHSHPTGVPYYSEQDDLEEPKLMEFFGDRLPHVRHGSLMIPAGGKPVARVWMDGWKRVERIRCIGKRFRFWDDCTPEDEIPEFFDRQVRAFGPDVQRVLSRLHVGIVGVGGTGSAVLEQLIRLGVGTVSVYDAEAFESSNVNRVYGSGTGDQGRAKTEIASRASQRIGLGTVLNIFPSHIDHERTAKTLRDCDMVFGCTDKQAPRGVLCRLALRYLIPVIDVAAKIHSENGIIRDVIGRVTVLMPGEACLFCRRRINSEIIRLESMSPDEWQALADEDYAPELEDVAPAVIPFTTMAAAQAVSELLQRLTGFMGDERASSETLLFFHEPAIRTNRKPPVTECLCSQRRHLGRGDQRSFLDLVWPHEDSD